jgi:hypothetical protein
MAFQGTPGAKVSNSARRFISPVDPEEPILRSPCRSIHSAASHFSALSRVLVHPADERFGHVLERERERLFG